MGRETPRATAARIDRILDAAKARPLTHAESDSLARAVRVMRWQLGETEGHYWTPKDVRQLRSMAAMGKRPAVIALALKRTTPAVRRKMRKLGVRIAEQGSLATAPANGQHA